MEEPCASSFTATASGTTAPVASQAAAGLEVLEVASAALEARVGIDSCGQFPLRLQCLQGDTCAVPSKHVSNEQAMAERQKALKAAKKDLDMAVWEGVLQRQGGLLLTLPQERSADCSCAASMHAERGRRGVGGP